jgi:dTDP-N-acetylfucosamine:lipid II N-acetylfucosaminyltransferase
MKYHLHIAQNEKFIVPFINFINSNYNKKEHEFAILEGRSEQIFQIPVLKNVKKTNKNLCSLLLLSCKMNKSKKIFLHGLFDSKVMILLFLQPWLLKKCFWIVWGGDLYSYRYRKHQFKYVLKEKLRTFVIKRLKGIITHVKGDYDLAKDWYGTKAEYFYSFIYPSNLYKEINFVPHEKTSGTKITIQVGNSADPTNNHIEIFELLKPFKNYINIICPLSYGDSGYKEKIINRGKEIFGDKFEALQSFLPIEKYIDILTEVDIAIFNHNRQQAIGNITTLIGLGKKVYIREDITTWCFCKSHELKVFNVNKINDKSFLSVIPQHEKQQNIKNVKTFFSEEKLKKDLKKIFI